MTRQSASLVPLGADRERDAPMPSAARFIVRMLDRLAIGSLTVRFPDGHAAVYGHGTPHADITLANWNVCTAALRRGDIGFGETYIAGDWSTSDLAALMDVMVANRAAIEAVFYGTWLGRMLYRVKHLVRRNSRTGSRRNVQEHYDIGNAFYAEWLDASMTYSSAIFDDAERTAPASAAADFAALPAAQDAKYGRVIDQLALPAGARVLELGCGWGGFAEAAARRDIDVTGLTLSTEQRAYACDRIAAAGLGDRARFELCDYRDARGRYDGIASIEMFEAVGEKYWPSYFACIRNRLESGGRAVVQTITIADHLFDDYRKGSDFIQQYIFPGGMLPSRTAFTAACEAAGLRIVDTFAFGQDYARTLAAWMFRFNRREERVRAQGFDTAFVRTWNFYLAYCSAGFRFENIDVVQFTLAHDNS